PELACDTAVIALTLPGGGLGPIASISGPRCCQISRHSGAAIFAGGASLTTRRSEVSLPPTAESGMEFGVQFFPDVKPEQKSGAQYFREALRLAEEAEELGFTYVR